MVTFSPALGSSAIVPSSATFQFLAVAEQGQISNDAVLEVWTNLSGEWREHSFKEHATPFGKLLVARIQLFGEGSYHFTYRIREASGNIIWLSQAGGNDNGYIAVKPAALSAGDFDPLSLARESAAEIIDSSDLTGNSGDIAARTIKYSLTDGEEGNVESFKLVSLGGWSSALVIERSKPTWVASRLLDENNGLSTIFDCLLLLYRSGSQVVACFPLSLSDASSTLRGCSEGSDVVSLRSERESSNAAQGQCVVAYGPADKLLQVIDACIATAKTAINESNPANPKALLNGHVGSSQWSLHETTKAVYCTWNSLGQDYTFSGVIGRLDSLKKQGTLHHFESILLDDGWQDVARSPENQRLRALRSFGLREGWLDVDLTCKTGESRLAAAVRYLKERYPEIKTVGVWMTLQGYWNGLHPDSEISQTYKLTKYGVIKHFSQYPLPPPFEHIYLPAPEDTGKYWVDYFTTLKSAGVDFVKVDNQANIDHLAGTGAGAMRYQMSRTARQAAYDIFGPGNLINCMAGGARNYNEFLSKRSSPAASLRTSDDFFPDRPDSHRFHIANNATTAFIDRKLSVTRDFDMFTSHHELAEYHAMLRCFTTAPMYITDSEPSNQKVFDSLGGKDVNGEYRILKTASNASGRLPSTAFTDVTGSGDGLALKVALPVPSASGVIMGVWNCRGNGGTAVDAVTKQEIEEAFAIDGSHHSSDKGYVVVYDENNVQPLKSLKQQDKAKTDIIAPIHLGPGTCKAITVVALQSFPDFDMAVLGLANKYAGLCSVIEIQEGKAAGSKSIQEVTAEPSKSEVPAEAAPAETSAETVESTSSEAAPAVSETAPLLPSKRRSTAHRSGSRILALLLFYRRDLRHARATFFQDFWMSPLKTLVKELRAAFGGPSTLPGTLEDASVEESRASDPAPEMQEAVQTAPKTYGTIPNGINGVNGSTQHEGDLSVASESSSATAVNEVEDKNQVIIKLSVAGKLMLWIPGFSAEDYTITLQGQEVASKFITASGDCVTLDMEDASQALSKSEHASDNWQIGISKK